MIYRAYYALIHSPRVTSKGLNTSAVFGFCNTLDEVLRTQQPHSIAVCFDPAGKTFRHEAYPEYKAQRQKQPEDITLAVPYIKRILEAYRIPCIEVAGYEADDVIGTLAKRASEQGYETYMMTLDKDYGQLVSDNVMMFRPGSKGKGFEIRGPKEVTELYGISSPKQVIDLLALEGDASDNVPGCPGVGEKTAAKLIKEWGSVENLLANTDKLKGALKAKVEANATQIEFSKYLVTINTDVPVDISLDSLRRTEPDVKQLAEIYAELEFRTFANRLLSRFPEAAAEGEKPAKAQAGLMGSLFDEAMPGAESAEPAAAPAMDAFGRESFESADSVALISRVVEKAAAEKAVAVALDTDGKDSMEASLRGIALAWGDGNCAYVPLPDNEFDRQEAMTMLEPLFASDTATIVSHDAKRCMIMLMREGIDMKSPYYDTSVAHYLLKPEMKHTLEMAAFDMLAYKTLTYELSDTDRKKAEAAGGPETPIRTAERACVTLKLMPVLEKAIADAGLTDLMQRIELPFVAVLASMEWEGARIDVAELAKMSIALTDRLKKIEEECYDLAGKKFNIYSPAQVGEILFGEMKIDPKAKRTKTGSFSTTEEILEKHRRQYPIIDRILKARALKKLLATYVDALPKLINPITGKIHTTYQQTVTATGRISSTNPNLQNIPIRTDDGREIRRAFIPDPGCLMLSADYSQIELRLIADFSGDEAMIDAFNSGEDIHRATAAKIYHEPIEDVTDNQRRNAKTANFGIIYGISAFGLSERLEIPRKEAKELIEGYMATYPKVKEYMDKSISLAREQGYVSTIKGRRRYLPDINSRNATVRGYAERNAINAPLQGSAADIIKIAMITIQDRIMTSGLHSRMIMQVHDELIFNVVPEEQGRLQEIVETSMRDAYSGRVTLEVGMGLGRNWLEAH